MVTRRASQGMSGELSDDAGHHVLSCRHARGVTDLLTVQLLTALISDSYSIHSSLPEAIFIFNIKYEIRDRYQR